MTMTRKALLACVASAMPTTAFAQAATSTQVDLSTITTAIVGGAVSIVVAVATAFINSRMKDKQAAQTLDNALTNSLGVVQNTLDSSLKAHPLQVTLPGATPAVAAGVQYVLDHAGDEAKRFGVTPGAIEDKINARLGVAKMNAAPIVPSPGAA
jgi:H+/gluconate symporter-like permease